MADESWYVVRNTPGVTGFVGSAGAGSKPNPLLEPEEVRFRLITNWVLIRCILMSEKPQVGEQVRNTIRSICESSW